MMYNRDASHVIKGTRSDGTAIEVGIVNGRELPTGEVTYMGVLDETKWGPFGYPLCPGW